MPRSETGLSVPASVGTVKISIFLLPLVLSAQVVTPSESTVFDKDAVHEIRLTFKQAGWYEQLIADYAAFPDNTPYREASLVWGTASFETVESSLQGK